MNNYNYIKVFAILFLLSSCSFLDKKEYDLRFLNDLHFSEDVLNKNYVGMTRKQIIYMFGEPIISDSFSDVYHYYLYNKEKNNKIRTGMLNLYFKENKVHFFNIQ